MNIKESFKNWLIKAPLLLTLSLGSVFTGGCGKFWETNFIEENAQKVINRSRDIVKKYKEECGVDIFPHPDKKETPVITINPDGSYALFYKAEFTESSKLEKIVKEQIPEAIVSKSEDTNQLIVKFSDLSKLSYLEELIDRTDRMPPQVLLKLSIYDDFGDWTQDFATKLDLRVNFTQGGTNFGAGTINANYPGASARVAGRGNMGTKYGIEIDTDVVKLKAILDVLESLGFVKHVYQTTLLASNNQKSSLSDEEKLPIPSYVVVGQNVVQTFSLETIKSFFEATPVIYENGIVELTFKAGIGSSKRPEGPLQYPVPVKDEVEINKVRLKVGQPFLVAGKLNELEVAVLRKDPILPFLKSKDWEKRAVRIWYEITPYRVIYFEDNNLKKREYEVIDLRKNQRVLPTTYPQTMPTTTQSSQPES